MDRVTAETGSQELDSQRELTVHLNGVELVLLAERGVYWPEQQALFVADTHFGKEASFQKQGIAAPRGGMTATLAALDRMLTSTQATRLIVLGDLFHARCSFAAEVRSEFQDFLQQHAAISWMLIEGNHDTQAGKLPREWGIEVVQPGRFMAGLLLHHQPVDFEPQLGSTDGASLQLCGHLHPALNVRSGVERIGRLPCFWLNKHRLVLPALGAFTGNLVVTPEPNDRVWLVVESQVIPFF